MVIECWPEYFSSLPDLSAVVIVIYSWKWFSFALKQV